MRFKNKILIGALTSKPYSFLARSWELKNIETIDLFDSLGSNINVNVKGSQIMRILPLINKHINEEWITDKCRYSYEGLYKWRYINPMIRKDNKYIVYSWLQTLDFIKKNYKEKNIKNHLIYSNKFSDLEHVSILKDLNSKLDNSYLNGYNISYDFFQNYFINDSILKFNNKKILIICGSNLRLENPIFNLKLKVLTNKFNLFVFFLGSSFNSTLKMIYLGNNLKILINILKGKHNYCNIISNLLYKNSKSSNIYNEFINNIHCIFGTDIINRFDYKSVINIINNARINNLKFRLNIMHKYSGDINMMELGAVSKKVKYNYLEPTFIYLNNYNKEYNKFRNKFVVFQGHHHNSSNLKVDVILPSLTFFEKFGNFLNTFGYNQKTKLIISGPINARNDWKITKMIGNNLDIKIKYYNNESIFNRINEQSINSVNSNITNKTIFEIKNNLRKNDYIFNMPMKSSIFNYYLMDDISKVSKIMLKCSDTIMKKKNNYN